MNRSLSTVFVVMCFVLCVSPCMTEKASGQLIHTQTPFQQGGSSFYESSGVNWSVRGDHFFANFGQGPLLPPFGNPSGDMGLRTGFGFVGGGLSGNLGFNFSQGSSSGFSSTTPSLTTTNGYTGSIFSGTVRPFVTGFSPVVGDYRAATAPASPEIAAYYQGQQADLQRRINAAANAKLAKTLEAYKRGLRAEEEGNLKMARANYKRALASATGPLRVEIYQRLQTRGR